MSQVDADGPVRLGDGMTRRGLLQAGSLAFAGLSLPQLGAMQARGAAREGADRNCIFLFLVGGPSQVDTFDPKPDAPAEYRGPFRPIRTTVPGITISEIFPKTARQADKFAIVRSMYHTSAGVHDTGHQMMQTGRLFAGGLEHPHAGCVCAAVKGCKSGLPPHVVIPGPIGNTGGQMPHGQTAGYLGAQWNPFVVDVGPVAAGDAFDLSKEAEPLREAYGLNRFGQGCLLARRLIERGVRFVTVNMFETVFNEITWDCHGSAPFSPLSCYRDRVGPMFDSAYSTLLADLNARGLLEDTLVVAMGEFGRTPKINPVGGRDHWTQCWSVLFAGGGVKGGQVIGASDEVGAYPKDRPTTPAEVVASVYYSMGVDLGHELEGPDGRRMTVVDRGVEPIRELF